MQHEGTFYYVIIEIFFFSVIAMILVIENTTNERADASEKDSHTYVTGRKELLCCISPEGPFQMDCGKTANNLLLFREK